LSFTLKNNAFGGLDHISIGKPKFFIPSHGDNDDDIDDDRNIKERKEREQEERLEED